MNYWIIFHFQHDVALNVFVSSYIIVEYIKLLMEK
jgi:hypothetical protein